MIVRIERVVSCRKRVHERKLHNVGRGVMRSSLVQRGETGALGGY